MFVVLCVLACVLSAQLWLAEAPERVKQQRDQTEMDASRGEAKREKHGDQNKTKKDRGK